MGGTHRVKGGTGKAEGVKLPDAGISLKQCPRKMKDRKRWNLLNWEDRCGIGRDMWARKAEQKKSVVSRSPQVPKWCSIRVAPATVSADAVGNALGDWVHRGVDRDDPCSA
jgi:hypothetical protein